jgi:hypothetical protein
VRAPTRPSSRPTKQGYNVGVTGTNTTSSDTAGDNGNREEAGATDIEPETGVRADGAGPAPAVADTRALTEIAEADTTQLAVIALRISSARG